MSTQTTTVALLYYRLASRGRPKKLAGAFGGIEEAQAWLAGRPRRFTPAKDGSEWLWLEMTPGVWAGAGRTRTRDIPPSFLHRSPAFRIETVELTRTDPATAP
jgi:hypothetical protein